MKRQTSNVKRSAEDEEPTVNEVVPKLKRVALVIGAGSVRCAAAIGLHNLAHHGEVIPVIPKFTQRISQFDTDKIPYIIEEGERAAEEQVPYIRSLLEREPAPMQTL